MTEHKQPLRKHTAGADCESQPEPVTEALWDWTEDQSGHEFIEFLHARGWDCVPRATHDT